MSHIPNSAMPHAVESTEPEAGLGTSLSEGAAKLAGMARAHPRTTATAGAAIVVGAIAAAAIPFLRAKQRPTKGTAKRKTRSAS
jgi:hypothetical protein